MAEETSKERGETSPSIPRAVDISRCDFNNFSRAFCILSPAKQWHQRNSMLADLVSLGIIHLAAISQVTKRGQIRTSSRGEEGAASLAPLVARPFYEQKISIRAPPTFCLPYKERSERGRALLGAASSIKTKTAATLNGSLVRVKPVSP